LIYACLQVLVKIREKPESRTTSGSFAKDAEKEIYNFIIMIIFSVSKLTISSTLIPSFNSKTKSCWSQDQQDFVFYA
jgi:hypothetical protein